MKELTAFTIQALDLEKLLYEVFGSWLLYSYGSKTYKTIYLVRTLVPRSLVEGTASADVIPLIIMLYIPQAFILFSLIFLVFFYPKLC